MPRILSHGLVLLLCVFFKATELYAQSISDSLPQINLVIDSLRLSPDSNRQQPISLPVNAKSVIPKKGKELRGVVLDFTTGEPISFATVFFQGTAVGKRADLEGRFEFILDAWPSDTLVVQSIGYTKKFLPLIVQESFLQFRVEMERSSVQMRDFVVKIDKDPALKLVKKVIARKAGHNMDKADNYSYEVYNKLEMDINKIPPKAFHQSPILKNFSFVKKFIDSSSEDKPFLPLFLTETISDYYYQKKPKKMKEFIKGSRISGYKNQSVSQLLGSMYQNINIYENQIPVFQVNFVSPIANDAPFFYKYQLTDTQYIDHKLCYQVIFTPKRPGEHTFQGDFWIHDTDFAVQKINMIVTKDQNINWVNKVTLWQEFHCFEDSLWFLVRDKFYVDFLPPHGDKVAGFLGRKTTTYKNIRVNQPDIEHTIETKKRQADTELDPDAMNRNETYWNSVRHDTLTKNEKAIYHMIDTIQSLPVYKTYYSIFYLLGTGIKEVGPIEIGPIYNLYSRNVIEGPRFRFNIGTTPKLFKDVYLTAYLAYGTKDQRFKYAGTALYLLKRQPRMYLYAEYRHDIDNTVNQYDNSASIDNVFSSIGRKGNVPWKLAFVDKTRFEFMQSFFSGFSYMLYTERKQYTPYAPLPSAGVFLDAQGNSRNSIVTNEIGLDLRMAYKEQFVEGNYWRTSLGTQYPIVRLSTGLGIRQFPDGEYSYLRTRLSVSDHVQLSRLGTLYYNVFGGRVFGTLPYPLLEIHPGNEFYYYNARTFNMMYRYEYISDKYVGLITEHAMGSLFFKYIPYVRKMKLRTFWNLKGVYGSLSPENQRLNLNKGYDFQTLRAAPYLEAGTGIENIFKVLRVDFVWRILPKTTLNDTPERRFGIFGSLHFSF
ncbi:MAG: carboxypeptidase-like regulatory domain-containing protein [Chitinophagaceae bacterium]|nr:carboxypeptidase-like regulatory domain-containing protein [Chitinophagaceae bacterium]